MIAEYEAEERNGELSSPRVYGVGQAHKHLKEMKKITGISREPLFSPIVADYYSGMLTSICLYTDMLNGVSGAKQVQEYFETYFAGQRFVKVMPFGAETETRSFLGSNNCSGWDGIQIFVTGNEERIQISSRFDNLGKGASGAAIQCLNVMLGCDEAKGLQL